MQLQPTAVDQGLCWNQKKRISEFVLILETGLVLCQSAEVCILSVAAEQKFDWGGGWRERLQSSLLSVHAKVENWGGGSPTPVLPPLYTIIDMWFLDLVVFA